VRTIVDRLVLAVVYAKPPQEALELFQPFVQAEATTGGATAGRASGSR
jgi:hypothetical protein